MADKSSAARAERDEEERVRRAAAPHRGRRHALRPAASEISATQLDRLIHERTQSRDCQRAGVNPALTFTELKQLLVRATEI